MMRTLAVFCCLSLVTLTSLGTGLAQTMGKPVDPAPGFSQTGGEISVAVLEFDTLDEASKAASLGKITAEMMTTAAVRGRAFTVVERGQLKKVLDENLIGADGMGASVAQAIGALVGAHAVLTGSVRKEGEAWRIEARVVDVGTGKVSAATSGIAQDTGGSLAASCDLLTKELARGMGLAKADAAPGAKVSKVKSAVTDQLLFLDDLDKDSAKAMGLAPETAGVKVREIEKLKPGAWQKAVNGSRLSVYKPWTWVNPAAWVNSTTGPREPRAKLVVHGKDDEGLLRNDIISVVEGREITDAKSLMQAVSDLPQGADMNIRVLRSGTSVDLIVANGPMTQAGR